MSGRLVILPKKSYCPWNPDNVARVQRDEQLALEQARKQQEIEWKRKGNERLQKLSHKQQPNDQQLLDQHANLFQVEEEEALVRRQAEWQPERRQSAAEVVPFYIAQPTTSAAPIESGHVGNRTSEREQTRKAALDPAAAFLTDTTDVRRQSTAREGSIGSGHDRKRHDHEYYSKPERSIKGKRRRRHNDDEEEEDKKSSRRTKASSSKRSKSHGRTRDCEQDSSKDVLAELRKRRWERERQERDREESILAAGKSRHRYNDQFHPSLAR